MGEEEKKGGKEEKGKEVFTAVYKLHLHCQECARALQKPITRIEGVQKVDTDVGSGKVTVKGVFDPKKVHHRIEKKSHRKVELISPMPKKDEKPPEKKEEKKEKKEPVVKTTVMKVYMHCKNCEDELKSELLKLEDVYGVKTNGEAQTCTVEGIMEPEKLIKYLRRKLHKPAEIVPPKAEKEKKEDDTKKPAESKEEKGGGKKEEPKITTEYVVPYVIHYYHCGPSMFSDENPNACSVM